MCDRVCPRREDFADCLREIDWFGYNQRIPIEQDIGKLPLYIPMIQHAYRRERVLVVPMVALSLYRLFRVVDGYYQCKVESANDLRKKYKLSPETRIILVGTGKDKSLEWYWKYRRRDKAAVSLRDLGIEGVVSPNFSHFLDVRYNRKLWMEGLKRAAYHPCAR